MRVAFQPLNLPLRHAFTIARSSEAVARNVLVRLRWGRFEGLGEAAPRGYYGQDQASCLKTLARMAPLLARAEPFGIEHINAELARRFPKAPAARAAVDIALHDLLAKKLGVPLWRYWGLDPRAAPPTSFTIGIDTLDMVRRKIAEAARFPILKVKLGVANDLEVIREVRRLCPRKVLRVDANGGWTVREAVAKAKVLEKLGVEFIEQPVAPGNPAALKRVQDCTGLPIFADESALLAEDVPALRGCVRGLNIKLVKCGGLLAARRMIAAARACGMKVMLGCMIESSVSITAAAHLSPLSDYADLDGALLLARDPFVGVKLAPGARLRLPSGPGLGVELRKEEGRVES